MERRPYQARPDRYEYVLTGSGRELLPALDALLGWGLRHAVASDDPKRQAAYRGLVEQDRDIAGEARDEVAVPAAR